MEECHRNVLRKGLLILLQNLKVQGVLDLIYSNPDNILSNEDFQKMLAQNTESDKIRHMVLILQKSGPKAFEVFMQALKQSGQAFIVDELLRESRRTDDPCIDLEYDDSQAFGKDLSGAECSRKRSTNNEDSALDLTGYIHQLQKKCQSARGYWYSSFVVQTSESTYQRCLTFFPDLHEETLERYATEQIPVWLKDCCYYMPTKRKYEKDTIKIDADTEFEDAKVRFAYNPPPFTPLANINKSCLSKFLSIKVEIVKEGELTKKPKYGKELSMQEKHVRDEKGFEMKLTAWQVFASDLRVGEWYELSSVSVKMFEGAYKLSTNPSTSAKQVNLEQQLLCTADSSGQFSEGSHFS